MHTILLIDDDQRLASLLREYFIRHDLTLLNATHPLKGIEQVNTNEAIDLVLLDIMLPDMDGFEVCRTLRKTTDIPILMLTARGEVMDRIVGLEIGADDYLSKPFESRELVARIHSILKRVNKGNNSLDKQGKKDKQDKQNPILQYGDLVIDKYKRSAHLGDQNLHLTTKEYALLLMFANEPQKNFNRDEIMNALTGIDAELFSRSIDNLVSRLRTKLKPLDCIQTVWGTGYRFVPPGNQLNT